MSQLLFVQLLHLVSGYHCKAGIIKSFSQLQKYANCTSIEYLWLGCETGAQNQITNVSALGNLTTITSKHPVYGISLGVYNCDDLLDLSPLGNLTGNMKGGLVVYDNAKLSSLNGLHNLTKISGETSQGVSLWIGKNVCGMPHDFI